MITLFIKQEPEVRGLPGTGRYTDGDRAKGKNTLRGKCRPQTEQHFLPSKNQASNPSHNWLLTEVGALEARSLWKTTAFLKKSHKNLPQALAVDSWGTEYTATLKPNVHIQDHTAHNCSTQKEPTFPAAGKRTHKEYDFPPCNTVKQQKRRTTRKILGEESKSKKEF